MAHTVNVAAPVYSKVVSVVVGGVTVSSRVMRPRSPLNRNWIGSPRGSLRSTKPEPWRAEGWCAV